MAVKRGLGVRNQGLIGSTPTEMRLVLAGLVAENSPGVPRQGLLRQARVAVVTGTAGMAYNVSSCLAVTTRTEDEGVYTPGFAGSTSVPAAAAPGSGYRWDLVWVKQNDPEKGDPNNLAVCGVTEGAAASSPAKPTSSVPAGAYVLAEALVPAGAVRTDGSAGTPAVVVTQLWRHTATRGAAIPVRDLLERAEITPSPGLQVARLDLGGLVETYQGGAWGVREVAVPFTSAGNPTGWSDIASALPLRVEQEGRWASLHGFIVRTTGTSSVVGTVPEGARPRRDLTWTAVAQNAGTTEGPAFRFYLSASTGVLSVNRLEGANSQPFWNNGSTQIAVSSGAYPLP